MKSVGEIPDNVVMIKLVDSIMSLAIADVAMGVAMDGHMIGSMIYSAIGLNAEQLHSLVVELERTK